MALAVTPRSRLHRGHMTAALVGMAVAQAIKLVEALAAYQSAPYSLGDWRTYLAAFEFWRSGRGADLFGLPFLAFELGLGFDVPLFYSYPPAFLLVVAPFAALGPIGSTLAWIAVNSLLSAACLVVLARELIPPADRRLFLLLGLVAVPTGFALRGGQVTMLLLAALTLVVYGVRRERPGLVGLGLAVLLLKPQLAPLLGLWLLADRRWRALAVAAAGGLVVLAASWVMVGATGMAGYVRFLMSGAGFGVPMSHGLLSLAYELVGYPLAWPLYIVLAAAVLTLWWRSGRPLTLTVAAALLIPPYLMAYDLTLWLVVVALSWEHAHRRIWQAMLAVGLFVGPALAVQPAVYAILSRDGGYAAVLTAGTGLVAYLLLALGAGRQARGLAVPSEYSWLGFRPDEYSSGQNNSSCQARSRSQNNGVVNLNPTYPQLTAREDRRSGEAAYIGWCDPGHAGAP